MTNPKENNFYNHPKLGKQKFPEPDDGPDMIDNDTDAQRIARHPILGKKYSNKSVK